jgi:hypothetical protein
MIGQLERDHPGLTEQHQREKPPRGSNRSPPSKQCSQSDALQEIFVSESIDTADAEWFRSASANVHKFRSKAKSVAGQAFQQIQKRENERGGYVVE